LIAVAIGMISPGPVVITATFVGTWSPGSGGSRRYRRHLSALLSSDSDSRADFETSPRQQECSRIRQRCLCAAIGTILGERAIGRIAIGDWLTVLLA